MKEHKMYCRKSGMICLVYHSDGICPDERDCEACNSPKQKEECNKCGREGCSGETCESLGHSEKIHEKQPIECKHGKFCIECQLEKVNKKQPIELPEEIHTKNIAIEDEDNYSAVWHAYDKINQIIKYLKEND